MNYFWYNERMDQFDNLYQGIRVKAKMRLSTKLMIGGLRFIMLAAGYAIYLELREVRITSSAVKKLAGVETIEFTSSLNASLKGIEKVPYELSDAVNNKYLSSIFSAIARAQEDWSSAEKW